MRKPLLASCHYCHRRLCGAEITLDHKVPKSAGGTRRRSNIVFACEVCNLFKGRTPYTIFLIQISLVPIDTNFTLGSPTLVRYQRQWLQRVRALGIFAEIDGEIWVMTAAPPEPASKTERAELSALVPAAHD